MIIDQIKWVIATQDIEELASRASSPITLPSISIKMEGQQFWFFCSTSIRHEGPLRSNWDVSMGIGGSWGGLVPSILNYLAYLFRWNLDIIHYLYRNQWGASILHQMVWNHTIAAENRTPSPKWPDSNGEDEVIYQFWNNFQDEGEDLP